MVLDISSLYLNMDSRGGTYSRDLSAERRNATRFYSRPSQFFLSLYDRCGCYRISFASPTVDFSYTAVNTSFPIVTYCGLLFWTDVTICDCFTQFDCEVRWARKAEICCVVLRRSASGFAVVGPPAFTT